MWARRAALLGAALLILGGVLYFDPSEPPPTPRTASRSSSADPAAARGGAPRPESLPRASVLDDVWAPKPDEASAGAAAVTVVGRGAGPLAGVAVRLESVVADASVEARTGAEGRARFEGLAPGAWTLSPVRAARFAPSSPRSLDISAGAVAEARIALEPRRSVRVFVATFEGEPAEDAELRVNGGDPVRADARGVVRLEAEEGAWVRARGREGGEARARVTPGVLARSFMVLRLSGAAAEGPRALIEGVVLDPTGAPAPEVLVSGRKGHGVPFGTVSKADGRFVLEVEPGAAYALQARAPDGSAAELSGVAPGARDVELRLEGGASLEGRVVDAEGRPAPFFTVRWQNADAGGPGQRSFADPEGLFSVEGLAPGRYRVEAESRTSGRSPLELVSVPESGVATVELRLEAPGRIEGSVVDEASGTPLPGAEVRLEGRSGLGRGPRTKADAAGRFVLDGVPAGRRSVAAAADGYRTRIVSALDVASGAALPGVQIALTPTEDPDGYDLVGIGAVLATEPGALVIRRVVEGGGAAESGLRPGARVLAVDGRSIAELGYDGAIQAIRGEEDTTVQLTVEREGGSAEVMAVLRRRIST